jgi:zinc transport system substrate-binding protein
MKPYVARPVGLAAALTLGAVLLAGCGQGSSGAEPGDHVRVAAAFYPLAFVAERVGGDAVQVDNLTSPGGEPHDLELTVKETVTVAEADVVVVEHGLQPAVDDVVENIAEGAVVDVAEVVRLHAAGEQVDPHFWLDPLLLADVADAVADELAVVDPAGAAGYEQRASDLRSDLEAIDAAYATGLAGCTRDIVVVSHDAFRYWERYGLTFEPIAGLSPDAEPSPADLARVQQLVEREGITTVFSETLASAALATTLAHDTGVSTAVLDPIEGLSDQTADEDYLSLMRANLAALKEANGC